MLYIKVTSAIVFFRRVMLSFQDKTIKRHVFIEEKKPKQTTNKQQQQNNLLKCQRMTIA